jgi:peptidase M23-like protein
MPFRPAVSLTGLGAIALVAVSAAVAAPAAPCVATGMLATLTPGEREPTVVGPTLAASDRESTTADAVVDQVTGLRVSHADLGVAGCVGSGSAPGGTAAHADGWSLLGAIRADTLEADLVPASGDGSGWRLRATYAGLMVNGTTIDVPVGRDVPVGDWGVLNSQVSVDAGPAAGLRWWRAVLALRLVHAHGGIPAGTTLLIGWVSANKRPAATPAPTPPPTPKPKPKPKPAPTTTSQANTTPRTVPRSAPKVNPKPTKPKPKPRHKPRRVGPKPHKQSHIGQSLRVTPPLAPGTYDFPLAGRVSWGDSYGGARSDVPGGWHHGDDLFANLGTPVVAVADGTVFAVGWNHVGGWRLWLRTDAGDAFYYAHLAGYTALARNNNRVRRGDVLGFVGNTGDAFTTQPHLHFEIHPNELLSLGYNGAVDPTTYLAAWHQINGVKAPPPVRLPSDAGRGQGALTDFRRLLAIRPLAHRWAPARPPAPPRTGQKARAVAAPVVSSEVSSSSGDGWAAIAAAIALAAIAAGSLGLAVRNGRSS